MPTRFCRKAFTAVHKSKPGGLAACTRAHEEFEGNVPKRGKKKSQRMTLKKTKKTGKWQVEQVSCHLCSRRKDLGVVIHVTCASH